MSITAVLVLLFILAALIGAALASWRRDGAVEQSWQLFAHEHKLRVEEPLLGDARVFGDYEGYALEVRRWGTGHADFTTATITLTSPLPKGLKLSNETLIDRVGVAAGMQDIQIGDEALDEALLIKGFDEEATRALLQDQHVRGRLKELVAAAEEVALRDWRLSASARGHVTAAELAPLLALLLLAARAIDAAAGGEQRAA